MDISILMRTVLVVVRTATHSEQNPQIWSRGSGQQSLVHRPADRSAIYGKSWLHAADFPAYTEGPSSTAHRRMTGGCHASTRLRATPRTRRRSQLRDSGGSGPASCGARDDHGVGERG
jgi:hypothetical protein